MRGIKPDSTSRSMESGSTCHLATASTSRRNHVQARFSGQIVGANISKGFLLLRPCTSAFPSLPTKRKKEIWGGRGNISRNKREVEVLKSQRRVVIYFT